MELRFPHVDPRLAELPVASAALDRFSWNLEVEHVDHEVRLYGGDVLIGAFTSHDELQTFVAGMAFALAVLPEEIAEAIDQLVGE